jgi:hypothetical protein
MMKNIVRDAVIIVCILALMVSFLAWLFWAPMPPPYSSTYWPLKAQQERAMKYRHGADHCIVEGQGCYFVRDGRRVWI